MLSNGPPPPSTRQTHRQSRPARRVNTAKDECPAIHEDRDLRVCETPGHTCQGERVAHFGRTGAGRRAGGLTEGGEWPERPDGTGIVTASYFLSKEKSVTFESSSPRVYLFL